MTDYEYEKFRKLIYNEFGNYLNDEKKFTLELKVSKIMKRFNPEIKSVSDYYDALVKAGKNSEMWQHFVDHITVHKTNFFRENEHFDYIKKNIEEITKLPSISSSKEIRVWCAAASTGEEPYSILMTLKECLPRGYKIKFLASDISELVLQKAISGVYSKKVVEEDVPSKLISEYFTKSGDDYVVRDEYKSQIVFRKVNLTEKFKFNHKFDIIFCRNVMIYFDTETKKKLIEQMSNTINPGGFLIVGLSESLGNDRQGLELVKSSIYIKDK